MPVRSTCACGKLAKGVEMPYIRFSDTGEIYEIIGERRQHWLFEKDGETKRVVKGASSYEIMDMPPVKVLQEYGDIRVRDEDGFDLD
jgi:hypothetical protein